MDSQILEGIGGLGELVKSFSNLAETVKTATSSLSGFQLEGTKVAGAIGDVLTGVGSLPAVVEGAKVAFIAIRNSAIAPLVAGLIELQSTMLLVSGVGAGTLLTGLGLIAGGVIAASITVKEGIQAWRDWQDNQKIVQADMKATSDLVSRGHEAWKKWGAGGALSARELKDAITGMRESLKSYTPSDAFNKLQGLPDRKKVEADIKAMQELYNQLYGVGKSPRRSANAADTNPSQRANPAGHGTVQLPPVRPNPFVAAENNYELGMSEVGAKGAGNQAKLEVEKRLLNDLGNIKKKGNLTDQEQLQLQIKINNAKERIRNTQEQIKQASNKGTEDQYALAVSKVGAFGTGAAGQLNAEKKLLLDLENIRKRGNLTDQENLQLQIKINNAKERINATEEKQKQDKIGKADHAIVNKIEVAQINGAKPEEILVLEKERLQNLRDMKASQDQIEQADLAVLRTDKEISKEKERQRKEIEEQNKALLKQGVEVGAGFAEKAIRGESISGGDVARGTGAFAGAVLGSVIPGLGTALGGTIGGIAGNLIGSMFDRKDSDAAKIQQEAAEKQKEAAEKQQKAAEQAQAAFELKRTQYEEGIISPEEWIKTLQAQAKGKMITSNPETSWTTTTEDGIAWAKEMKAAREALAKKQAGGATLTGVELAEAQNQAGLLDDQGLLNVLQQKLAQEKGEHGDKWASTTQEGLSLSQQIKGLAERIKGGIAEGVKEAFSSITSFNPLPVEEVTKGNFFAMAPKAIFYGEQRIIQDLNVNVAGSDNPEVVYRALDTPRGQRALAKYTGFEGQRINLNLGFA